MIRTLILGAGGHAQVVADILLCALETGGPYLPLGYLDDRAELHGVKLLGLPIMGSLAALGRIEYDAVIVAIGNNQTRAKLFTQLQQRRVRFATALHPSAVVARDARIGIGNVICARSVINPGSSLGNNNILNTAATIDHHNHIADHVHIAPGVHLGGEVAIDTGAFVGIGATVMPRCQIGAWTTVGAGAVVHRDLPAQVVAVGVPAQIIHQEQSAAVELGK